MVNGDDGFVNNPFQQLNASVYPEYKSKKDAANEAKDQLKEEKDFFIENVHKFEPAQPVKKSGFSIADHGVELGLGKNKSRKAKNSKFKKLSENFPLPEKNIPGQPVEEESEQFIWAMRDTAPLKPGGRMVMPVKKPKSFPAKEDRFADMLLDNLEFSLLNADEYLEGYVKNLDESILNRLRAGKFGVEAHLDLHGLNSLQAFEAMRDFIKNSWFKGMRTVLLVPGRGLNSPNGQGVLRQKIQQWLTHEPFKGVVLAFCTARPQDGGPGSVYVLLRVNRKRGCIYWERMPPDPDLYD